MTPLAWSKRDLFSFLEIHGRAAKSTSLIFDATSTRTPSEINGASNLPDASNGPVMQADRHEQHERPPLAMHVHHVHAAPGVTTPRSHIAGTFGAASFICAAKTLI
jgi:hypothetical protein